MGLLSQAHIKSVGSRLYHAEMGLALPLHLQVGPRMSFSTAWSANAVSICQSTGLGKVERIEVSRRFRLAASSPLTEEETARFAALVWVPRGGQGCPCVLLHVV